MPDPTPMRSGPDSWGPGAEVRVALFRGGACRHPHGMVVRGASWRPHTFPSLFAVISHPRQGITLFDTGYSARFLTETQPFPARFYRWLTPVQLRAGESAVEQLAANGIAPAEVQRIVLSHLHADHMAGVNDFPKAQVICTRAAFDSVRDRGAVGRLLRAFLPGLMPAAAERMRWLNANTEDFGGPTIGPFGAACDLFSDGSVLLVRLPGHAAGQVGALLRVAPRQWCFLVGDAAWTRDSFRELRGPNPLAHVIFDDAPAATRTLQGLHQLWKDAPEVELVPSHCDEGSPWDAPGCRWSRRSA